MATSFDDIYGLNLVISNDVRLNSLPTNLYYFVLYQYLQFSIGEFNTKSWTSLALTEFDQDIYQFVGDGVTDDFVLSPTPEFDTFYVSVNNIEISSTGYTYNSTTKTITLSTIPSSGEAVYIANYQIGSFTASLNTEEKTILAIGMNIPFLKSNIFTSKQLKQMISAAPIIINSQANHNKVNKDLLQFSELEFRNKIKNYSWRNDPDSLEDVVGTYSDTISI